MRVAFFGGSFDPPHNGHLAVARAARAAFALDAVLFAPVGMQPLKPEGLAASFEDRLAMTRLAIAGEPGFQVSLADAPKSPDAPQSAGDRTSTPKTTHHDALDSTPNYTPNYTIDTLERLRTSLAPDCVLYCLMGADSFFGLHRWHRAAELPFVAPLIVASRPGQPLPDLIVDPKVDLKADLKAALPTGLAFESPQDGSRNESGIEVRAFILVNQAGDRAPFYVLPGLHVEISASEFRAQIHAASGSPAAGRDLVPQAVRNYIAQHGLYRS
ncbi:MAG: nicotinate-nucleotide adenylyltransferase [Terracidiphilus sp.]|jgi:nicotinate-nucleotide adenylyltransferase